MSDCLQALAVNARKAGSLRLQFLDKLHYIWAYLGMNVYQPKCVLSAFRKQKLAEKRRGKLGTQPHYFCI